jgi:thiamine biosynthesis lipoprotein ApbE
LGTAGCTAAQRTEEPVVLQGEAQGTTFAITYWPVSETPASERVADSIQRYLLAFNKVASAWDTGSVISRWNRGVVFDDVEPAEWDRLLKEGQRIKDLTNGWMDPEVGCFTTAWGFNGQKAVLGTGNPSADSARIRELMGLTKPIYGRYVRKSIHSSQMLALFMCLPTQLIALSNKAFVASSDFECYMLNLRYCSQSST